MAKDHPKTNPITIKPKTASQGAEQFSWVPLPYCSPPGCPFPIKSLALSAHVSPQTIHFRVLDKSPVSGHGRGRPSCNSMTSFSPFYGLGSGTSRSLGKRFRLLKGTLASLLHKPLFFLWHPGVSLILNFFLFGFLYLGVVKSPL